MAINKIGVLTSGGDASGMNAAVRAIVRTGLDNGFEVCAICEGYRGLIEGGDKIRPLRWSDVGGIIHRGGTVIGSARSEEFRTREGRLKAARNMLRHGIDSLVVVGGDGSLTGADTFRREWPGLLEDLVTRGEVDAAVAGAASPPDGGRPGRLDRQRRRRHRHDHRRRHGASPDHRGDRCDQQHRLEPPARLHRRGDGPALRLPRADGGDCDRRRRALHPRVPADRRRLGGQTGRRIARGPRGGPAPLDRRPGGGRYGSAGHAHHHRAAAPGAAPPGSARRCA